MIQYIILLNFLDLQVLREYFFNESSDNEVTIQLIAKTE